MRMEKFKGIKNNPNLLLALLGKNEKI